MQKIDAALAPFIREMEGAGTWNDVAIVSASDFGRTLTSNGRGSDHAWAGHHFVMGGDVKGGQMFGKYPPDLAETDANPLNIGRGRLIPTLGWEAICSRWRSGLASPTTRWTLCSPTATTLPPSCSWRRAPSSAATARAAAARRRPRRRRCRRRRRRRRRRRPRRRRRRRRRRPARRRRRRRRRRPRHRRRRPRTRRRRRRRRPVRHIAGTKGTDTGDTSPIYLPKSPDGYAVTNTVGKMVRLWTGFSDYYSMESITICVSGRWGAGVAATYVRLGWGKPVPAFQNSAGKWKTSQWISKDIWKRGNRASGDPLNAATTFKDTCFAFGRDGLPLADASPFPLEPSAEPFTGTWSTHGIDPPPSSQWTVAHTMEQMIDEGLVATGATT